MCPTVSVREDANRPLARPVTLDEYDRLAGDDRSPQLSRPVFVGMTRERTYRCLDCLEHTLSRPFDVSHLSVTCPVCESFQRFVNEGVYDQYRALEEDPPDHLDWSRLGKVEKLMLSDGIDRKSVV